MASDNPEHEGGASGRGLPAVRQAPWGRRPMAVDAEFSVLWRPPRLWRLCRDYWWALGPYLAYCAILWGLAALISGVF